MATTPDQRKTKPARTTQGDGAKPPKKRGATPTDPAEKRTEGKRKEACDALGERFPEQCDAPLSETDAPQPMPDKKTADSRPRGRDDR